MKKIITVLFVLLSIASFAQEATPLTSEEKLELLWSQYLDDELDPIEFYSFADDTSFSKASEIIKIRKIEQALGRKNTALSKSIKRVELDKYEAQKVAALWLYFGTLDGSYSSEELILIKEQKKYLEKLNVFSSLSKIEAEALFFKNPIVSQLKLFMFCRKDRNYPCLMIMKDVLDQAVMDGDVLWSVPVLGLSKKGYPYNMTNGYTPTGVHLINSVMPEANRQQAFGQFRRLILEFVKPKNTINYMPIESEKKRWWKRASVARDIGRKWLRIHGTGWKNTDPNSSYYPHFATSGCISTRELEYDGIVYKDQRLLLDKMMEASDLLPVFTNEVKLQGVLYVVEIDDQKKKVTLSDPENLGLE